MPYYIPEKNEMDNNELKELKAKLFVDLQAHLKSYVDRLNAIDSRLADYVQDAVNHPAHINIYEALGIRKVFRLMDTYEVNAKRVRKVLRAIEGCWEGTKHIGGGLKFDTPRGHQNVRLMAYQVWCVFGIYGFDTLVDMEREWCQDLELLPSEIVIDNQIFDKRRLCNEAHIFQTRKSGKTEFGAALDVVEANVLGPSNAQVAIIGNSKQQAIDIAFKAIKEFCWQLDPKSINKQGGEFLKVNANEMSWLPNRGRTANILAVPAGGKPKDGYNASWVHADEHGQAKYVNQVSDMEQTVQVFTGSMGVRRERMLLHTTTAGLVNEGPYQIALRKVEELLLQEAQHEYGTPIKTAEDGWFAFLLRLDPWDFKGDMEELNKKELWLKVNRSIGTTVQPSWYRERIHDALTKGDDIRKEVLTKDFNVWQSEKRKDWIKAEEIRALQCGHGLKNLKKGEWIAFCGMDFSQTNDLTSLGWLCINVKTKQILWDVDAFVAEEQLGKSPNASLYKQWAEDGWLHVCPGSVISDAMVLDSIVEASNHVNIVAFGYDSYDSDRFVGRIQAWMVGKLRKKGIGNKAIEEELKLRLQPVPQTWATYNASTQVVWDDVHWPERKLFISPNPLIPWCFGNAILDEDRMGNCKPIKVSPDSPNKVDCCQTICTCYIMIGRWNK